MQQQQEYERRMMDGCRTHDILSYGCSYCYAFLFAISQQQGVAASCQLAWAKLNGASLLAPSCGGRERRTTSNEHQQPGNCQQLACCSPSSVCVRLPTFLYTLIYPVYKRYIR
jgi:hypothetical protein